MSTWPAGAIDSGANLLVAGSAIYLTGNSIAESVRDLRGSQAPSSSPTDQYEADPHDTT